jgi:hypothetical protein
MIFLIWILIIIIVGILICSYLNYLYKKTNDYANQCIDIKNYLDGIPRNLKMVNLGSTYSKFAFASYDALNIKGCDLSLQCQSLDVDYAILKKYRSHIEKNGIVFVVLAAACMLFKGNSSNPLYYLILDKKNNPKHSIRGRLESRIPLLFHPKRVKNLIKDQEKYKSVYDSMSKQIDSKQSVELMDNMADCWIKMFDLKNLIDTNLSQANIDIINKNISILEKIIKLCEQENLTPVIVIPPFSNRMNRHFSKEFVKVAIEDSVKKAFQNKNIIFLNYQWDEYFQDNYSLFADGGFRLNEIGSKIFIRKVIKDLHQYGLNLSNKELRKDI